MSEYDDLTRAVFRRLAVIACCLSAAAVIALGLYLSIPAKPKYSNVPGQNHPYCPPDPKECN